MAPKGNSCQLFNPLPLGFAQNKGHQECWTTGTLEEKPINTRQRNVSRPSTTQESVHALSGHTNSVTCT